MVGQVGDDLVARLWERNRALEESEQRFRGLVDDSPEPLVVHIAQKIAYANLAAARAFGLDTTAALIGRSILDLATPETKRQILARMATPSELRALDVVEQVFLRPDDGLELHVEVHSVRIEFAGQPAMLSVARDITRRVAAERLAAAALHELEFERLRIGSLLASSTAFMAVTRGKDHVFELANAAYCKLVGRDELIGKATIDAVPEIRGQGMIEMLDKVFETGVPFAGKSTPVRVRYGGTDVEQRYIDFTCQPLRQADGTTSGVFTHGVDVTEATVAQQRLRAQFDGVPVPTYVWQRVERDAVQQFVLVDFNRAALAISRNGIERFRGTTAATFFVDNPEITDEIERCFATGESSVRELDRTLISTGQRKRLLVTYTAAPPDVVVVHTEDVTERRKLEQRLQQAQKMDAIGRLAGGVAHDFNNILSVVLSYTEMYLADLKPQDPLRVDLAEIHSAGLRGVGLTRQLLAFGRKQVLEPRALDLDQTIRGLETMFRRMLGEDIDLSLLSGAGSANINADPSQIEQVLMNLVVNARDAMPTGGKLSIETANVELDEAFANEHFEAVPGPYVMLAVSDTGCGMDEATRSRIFEPFFTTKGPIEGTGLGLATVFGIVHQSGGTVWVYSEPGQGTTFKLYLPRLKGAHKSAPIPTIPLTPAGGSETILLVEDDEPVRVLACTVLRRAGYTVLEAANGGEAFLLAEDFPATIHMVVSDVVMPRMSGRKLVERLVLTRPDLKIIYMSGYADDAVVHHGVLESGVAFLQKPITADILTRKVRAVLDGGGLRSTRGT